METSPLPVNCFKFWHIPLAIEQWGFFSVPYLLCPWPIFEDPWYTHTYCRAFGSEAVTTPFNDLGLFWPGIETRTGNHALSLSQLNGRKRNLKFENSPILKMKVFNHDYIICPKRKHSLVIIWFSKMLLVSHTVPTKQCPAIFIHKCIFFVFLSSLDKQTFSISTLKEQNEKKIRGRLSNM